MLAMGCPRCGAPVPLAVGAPDEARCAFCGESGPTPEPVHERLRKAAAVIGKHAARERQLHGLAGGVVRGGRALELLFSLFVVLALLPAVCMFVSWSYAFLTGKGFEAAAKGTQTLALVPLVVIVGITSVVSLVLIRRVRRRVEVAAAAVPPEREGEPARCHVCGGPLSGEGVRGLVRCGYCDSDNVVRPDVLARAAAGRQAVLEDYAAEVDRQGLALGHAFGWAALAFTAVSLATPVLCVAPTWIVLFLILATTSALKVGCRTAGPPTPGNRYGLVEVQGDGTCICWHNPYTGRWEREGRTLAHPDVAVDPSAVKEVRLDDLVGRRLRAAAGYEPEHGLAGTAAEPRWFFYINADDETVAGPDSVELVGAAPGKKFRAALWRLCVDEGNAPDR